MKADTDRIEKAASNFSQASKEISRVANKLAKTVDDLEDHWQDSGQQKFQLYYKEWVQHAAGLAQLLDMIGFELDAVADRYKQEDKKPN